MTARDEKMNLSEVSELMQLRGWSQAKLARQIDCSEAAISRWFSRKQHPTGPTRKLLQIMLKEARAKSDSLK